MPDPPPALIEIAVRVAGIDAEVAADILRQKCPGGGVIQPGHRLDEAIDAYVVDGDAPALVTGYLPAKGDTQAVTEALRLALQMAPLQSEPGWQEPRLVAEESWRDAWKKYWGVQRHGRALIVKPTWVAYRLRGKQTVIEIDPGMAFGTGQHPTTGMCLRALEDLVRPGMSVLDLGSGSGILSIAAARLGAARVLAVDIDPQAVKAGRENAAANRVAAVVEVREGTLDAAGGETFELVVANISGPTLERLAPDIARALKPGGLAILSGFLVDTADGLAQVLERLGLKVEQRLAEGVWRGLIARR